MADIAIPSANEAGYWHFTYITTDPLTGQWYGGKRSTKRHPSKDRYIGSGNWVRSHPDQKRLIRAIVGFYDSSEAVFAAEAKLITWQIVRDNPLCMNLRNGGEGVSVEAALLRYTDPAQLAAHRAMLKRMHADPIVSAKRSASAKRRFSDPIERVKQTDHLRRITSDPVCLAKAKASRETPEWLAAQSARMTAHLQTPAFKAAQKAARLRQMADPVWQAGRTAKNRKMAKDPTWLENSKLRLADARKRRAEARGVIYITINGELVPLSDACRAAGASYQNALYRRKVGRPQYEWLAPPNRHYQKRKVSR